MSSDSVRTPTTREPATRSRHPVYWMIVAPGRADHQASRRRRIGVARLRLYDASATSSTAAGTSALLGGEMSVTPAPAPGAERVVPEVRRCRTGEDQHAHLLESGSPSPPTVFRADIRPRRSPSA